MSEEKAFAVADAIVASVRRYAPAVQLNTRWKGSLPKNDPPIADSVTVQAEGGVPLSITLSGRDPDNDELGFSVIKEPSHGKLSGMVPTDVAGMCHALLLLQAPLCEALPERRIVVVAGGAKSR